MTARARALGLALLALGLGLAGRAAAQPCPDCLRAGAATVRLAIPAGTPLAGYGALARRLLVPDVLGRHPHAFWLAPATGELDPLAARALVLDAGPSRLAWVTVDLVAVDGAFTRDVRQRLAGDGARPPVLIISASHTHSGPGAFVDSALMAWLAVDRADAAVREALIDGVVTAVRRAEASLEPARVGSASAVAPPVARSRLGRPLDPEVVVLKVTSAGGRPLALVWNFAIHGTMLGPRNLRLSADVMGVASRALERELGVVALFVNGAVGDVSPARHGEASMPEVGRQLAAAAREAWSRARPAAGRSMAIATAPVRLPPPRLAVRNCVGRWLPRLFSVPLDGAFARSADLVAVALGDTGWVTIPGEPATSLGRAIKARARPGVARPFVAGVSNGYLGYFVTEAEYDAVTYVTCATLYGPRTGQCLAQAAGDLLAGLRAAGGGRQERGPTRCDRGDPE